VASLSELIHLETELASILAAMAYDVEHMECFDCEERAEIYTILHALQADTRKHSDTVSLLADRRRGEYVHDA